MALVVKDRVQEVTYTNGTGPLELNGATLGFQSFAVIGNDNTTFYCIVNDSQWEVGLGTYSTTGPTLFRTTVYATSNGNTSPISLYGTNKSVFCTYVAGKSVNLDASGNVSPLGTITSGTWNGNTIPVVYGGTGVTSSSGANSVVLRDTNQNISFNNFIAGLSGVTAAAGTTVLTVASTRNQLLVGSTTQTFKLPNATTLQLGQSFLFINNSSGVLTVTDNANTTIETIPSGGITQLGVVNIGTSAGSWGIYSFLPGSYNFNNINADFSNASIINAVWNGTNISPAYGGTGLTTFTGANNALYSTSASALTAGTLPVPAGGTGQISFPAGYIPYGDSSAALQSSSSLQFNGTYLVVGGTTPLGGATNPITAFSSTANNFVQTYVYNSSAGTSASADFVAYANNSTDTQGFADMGFTSSTYADALYSVTGPNEAYLFGSARGGAGSTGNLVYATDNTGSANAHQWYVGGFTQAKGAWKMQLTSTGLQLANSLAVAYGGTGATTAAAARTNLGATTVGSNMFTLTNPSAITFPRFNADNTVSALDAATFRTAIGAGTGSGTVTGVTATSPVVSSGGAAPTISLAASYGDTQNPYTTKSARLVLASPSGSSGFPTFRALVAADIPTLNQNTTGTASNVTGTVAIVNGGTGQTTTAAAFNSLNPMTTTGDIIYEASPTTAARLGIGSSGQVLTVSGGIPAWINPSAGPTTTLTTTSFTATSGQTSFTVAYTPSLLQGVYRNGIKLDPADYTASTGTTIVLATGAITGDNIQVQTFDTLLVVQSPNNITGGAGGTITALTSAQQFNITALGAAATFAAPAAAADGQKLLIRIKDNGTARALTWTTSAGGYRALGVTLPTTTVASTPLYVGCVYNSQDSYWDVLAVSA